MYAKEQSKKKKIALVDNHGSVSIQFQLDGKTYKFNPVKGGKYDDPIALGASTSNS
jgi:hypothetical protein